MDDLTSLSVATEGAFASGTLKISTIWSNAYPASRAASHQIFMMTTVSNIDEL
jgi:hypothetical protein